MIFVKKKRKEWARVRAELPRLGKNSSKFSFNKATASLIYFNIAMSCSYNTIEMLLIVTAIAGFCHYNNK